MKKAFYHKLGWLALSTGILSSGSAFGVDLYTIDTDEPEPRKNEVVLNYGAPEFDEGDAVAQAAQSLRIPDTNLGGIERFHIQNSDDSDWRVYIDGRWLVNPDEILISLEAFKEESIFLDIDFRHWVEYDYGAGIYYPPTDAFFILSADALEEEINKLEVTFRFKPSDSVQWKIGYSFFNREGDSVSTRFGDDFQYDIGRTVSRGIVPAMNTGEETVHKVELGVEKSDDVDKAGVRIFYQRREVDRQRVVERAASQASANRFTRQEEESKDDLYGLSAYSRKLIRDDLTGSVGFAYTRLDGDLTGSRVFGANPEADYDIDFVASQLNDRGFLDLEGTRQLKQWIINANLVYEPEGNYRWMAGVRMEHLSTEAFSSYLDTYDVVDWGDLERQNQEADMLSSSEKSALDLSGFLELRYKGLAKTLLYTRLEGATQSGDLDEAWTRQEVAPNQGSSVSLLDRATEFDRSSAFWELGANYYPKSYLKISIEGYLKYRDNQFDFATVELPDDDFTLYPGYIEQQEFYTEDLNARVHWRILKLRTSK